jgi:hypothetical protein
MTQAEYMRDYRKRNPSALERQRKLQTAVGKALRELRDLHRTEYERLLTKHKAKAGLVD